MSLRAGQVSRGTIVAIATSSGRSGVGIIRVSGDQALSIAESITSKNLEPRVAVYSNFVDSSGDIIDKGICLYFPNPHSYTGEDVVEFHGHGSPVALSMLQDEIVELGARLAGPGEFTERAFLNGKMDLYQAETVADLIEARSIESVKSAMRSLQGIFSQEIHELLDELISIRVYVESALDFSEEEIDFLAEGNLVKRLTACIEINKKALQRAKQGKLLNEGISIAIVGRPNVGKSSLMNALLGEDAAIVTEIAGTTRDRLEHDFIIDGVLLHLIDTAGLRQTDDMIEQEGIKRSRQTMEMADWIFCLCEGEEEPDANIITSAIENNKTCFLIRNKSDLYAMNVGAKHKNDVIEIRLSAKTHEGIEDLIFEMKRCLQIHDLSEDVCLARQRHVNALAKALLHIMQGLEQIQQDSAGEILAQELRWAQEAVAEITGEYHADDLLGEIFSRFCIGK